MSRRLGPNLWVLTISPCDGASVPVPQHAQNGQTGENGMAAAGQSPDSSILLRAKLYPGSDAAD